MTADQDRRAAEECAETVARNILGCAWSQERWVEDA